MFCCDRASFELELGAAGQKTDFKETSKMLEWSFKKASLESLSWFAIEHVVWLLPFANCDVPDCWRG